MNKETYRAALSGVRHSDLLTERLLEMTKTNTRKAVYSRAFFAAAVCLLLLAAGLFGGTALRKNKAMHLFTVTAYADSGAEINLRETPLAKAALRLKYTDGNQSVAAQTQGFRFDGKRVQSVTFSAQHGSFSYQTYTGNDVKATYATAGTPYACALTLALGSTESAEVFYNPEEAVDRMLNAGEPLTDLSVLPSDAIAITVTYRDGTTAAATIRTSFDRDGCLHLVYTER